MINNNTVKRLVKQYLEGESIETDFISNNQNETHVAIKYTDEYGIWYTYEIIYGNSDFKITFLNHCCHSFLQKIALPNIPKFDKQFSMCLKSSKNEM